MGPAEQDEGGSLHVYQYLFLRHGHLLGRSMDHHQGGGGEGQRGAFTYRPRSVNSLLILLSAMACGDCVCKVESNDERCLRGGCVGVWCVWYAERGCKMSVVDEKDEIGARHLELGLACRRRRCCNTTKSCSVSLRESFSHFH
jgi:hypothetical protein